MGKITVEVKINTFGTMTHPIPTPKGADLASPACMALVVFLPRPESQYIIWVPCNKNRNKSS